MKLSPYLVSLLLAVTGCSDNNFAGGGSAGKSGAKGDSSSGQDDEELGTEEDVEDSDSETAVVAVVPENVAGAYLTCVSDQEEGMEGQSDATLGCVVLNQSRTDRVSFAGLDIKWTLENKESGETISFDSLRVSDRNRVHGLLRAGAATVAQPVRVTINIKGTDKVTQLTGDFPDANVASIPYMVGIKVRDEIETARSSTRRHVIFVTSQKYGPGAETKDGRFAGIAGADGVCAGEAATAGLSGSAKWKAVMGDSGTSPVERIRIRYAVYRTDDETSPLFEPKLFGLDDRNGNRWGDKDKDWDWNYWAGKFFGSGRSVTAGADGKPAFPPGEAGVWTGSAADGKKVTGEDANSSHCSDWKSSDSAANGVYALADTMEKWLQVGKDSCDKQYRLLCISQ
jgi:hypothetical protein